jgi:hypothetical protein
MASTVTLTGSAPAFTRVRVTRPVTLQDPLVHRGAVTV